VRPGEVSTPAPANGEIADRLDSVANLLEEQSANQYRVHAWRTGANTIRALGRPAADIVHREGAEGLDRLPGIGPSLARAVREIVETGRLATLERLRGAGDPLASLASVAGVGDVLARRIHETLAIDSLEELEAAAHDGRLARVSGFGPKRVEGVREALATRLAARRRTRARPDGPQPGVAELLDVDREYRGKADAHELTLIAPRRFNPGRKRWLPVLHTSRGERLYTALYSNTALAHQLGRTHDWAVLYFDGREGEHQCTVVTATRGAMRGRRVVRGREQECEAYYGIARDNALPNERRFRHATKAAAV
jgi:hypothetical protein